MLEINFEAKDQIPYIAMLYNLLTYYTVRTNAQFFGRQVKKLKNSPYRDSSLTIPMIFNEALSFDNPTTNFGCPVRIRLGIKTKQTEESFYKHTE